MHVDLHCHSIFSDGTLSPQDLAWMARAQRLDYWALTDHDELSGLAAAQAAAQDAGVPWISGVEISVTCLGRTVHIVGLNFNPQDRAMQEGLTQMRSERDQRAKLIAARLEALGVQDALTGAMRYVGNPALISRTHFARHMVAIGFCRNQQQVFDLYLGDGKPACVEQQWASLECAVQWIKQAGGVAVIAHPGRYKFSPLEEAQLIEQFIACGGSAIEVVTSNHSAAQTLKYADIARKYKLAASLGSDYHGPGQTHAELGVMASLPPELTPVWALWR